MKSIAKATALLALTCAMASRPASGQSPVGTAFTYQGRLTDAGVPATGSFDLQFALFDAATGGVQVGSTQGLPATPVAAGLFTVTIDFGPGSNGPNARWLEIRVRPAGGGVYTTLAPRQRITPGPNAVFATTADLLDGLNSTQLLRNDQSGTLTGVLTVNGALSSTATSAGGVAVRGTGPGSTLGDGVWGTTGSGGRAVIAQNTAGNIALLASSFTGDHIVASSNTGLLLDPVLRVTNAGSILSEGTVAVGTPITTTAPGSAFNSFGNGANKDEAVISAANDVYVEGGLEVDGNAFVDGNLHLGGLSITDNDSIFFDSGTAESLTWNATSDTFVFSDRVEVENITVLPDSPGFGADINGGSGEDLRIIAYDQQRFIADRDFDDLGDFQWYRTSDQSTNQVAELRITGTSADLGDLLIRGQLSTGVGSFDLAERFRESDDVEPGELVAADESRPGSIRRTRGEGDAAVLGVVSTDPALLIGGTTLDVGALDAWGADLGQEFREQQEALEAEVLTERPAWQAHLASARSQGRPTGSFEEKVEQRAIELFASRRLAAVALAGRVPVRIDGSFGDIAVGDALAPSPVPGVAMKARKGGLVVGTALEPFSGGRGQVLMFVHRGLYAPPDDERMAALEERIAQLERAVARLEARR